MPTKNNLSKECLKNLRWPSLHYTWSLDVGRKGKQWLQRVDGKGTLHCIKLTEPGQWTSFYPRDISACLYFKYILGLVCQRYRKFILHCGFRVKWRVIIAVDLLKPEKYQGFNKIRTRDLREPVRCSTNWAVKPHIGSEVILLSSYLPGQWNEMPIGRASHRSRGGSSPVEALIFSRLLNSLLA